MIGLDVFCQHGKHQDAKYVEYASDITNSGKPLLSIIDDVLDLSKIEAGKLQPHPTHFSLHDSIRACARMFSVEGSDAQTRVAVEFDEYTDDIYADERMVKQTLMNLISNANKYTADDGRILVRTGRDDDGGIVVSVIDNGVGIAEEELSRVLEPFTQARAKVDIAHKGTGLGLPIAKNLMEIQGGTLSIESEPGVGTSVRIWFPGIKPVDVQNSAQG